MLHVKLPVCMFHGCLMADLLPGLTISLILKNFVSSNQLLSHCNRSVMQIQVRCRISDNQISYCIPPLQ